MKLSGAMHTNRAMTLIEVLVVVIILAVLIAIVLPAVFFHGQGGEHHLSCINNLKMDGLALKIWEGDNNDHWPQSLSITDGGARELLAAGNVAGYFEVMSNELATPKILACPSDEEFAPAVYFSTLLNTNISYLVSLDADKSDPQAAVFADDNFAIDGVPVKSGVLNLWTNRSVSWTTKRHNFSGNVAFVDGSVRQFNNAGLTKLQAEPTVATNLIVIP